MIAPTNYYKYIERLKTKSFEELVEMRDELINDIFQLEADERAGIFTSVSDALYLEYNKKLSLVIDELNIKYDKLQSGFSEEELYADEDEESVCPRCKFPSRKYRYCPKCNFLKLLSTYDGPDMYDEDEETEEASESPEDEIQYNPDDELLSDAVLFGIESGKVSVATLQKNFEIGFARAARLIEIMETKGYVKPIENSKFREVLISKDEFLSKK